MQPTRRQYNLQPTRLILCIILRRRRVTSNSEILLLPNLYILNANLSYIWRIRILLCTRAYPSLFIFSIAKLKGWIGRHFGNLSLDVD